MLNRRLTSEDDVFFCPGMDLLTMWARYLAALDLGIGPQIFLNCLPTRRQLRRRGTSDKQPLDDGSGLFFPHCCYHKFLTEPINDARFIDIVG